jgi:formate dehydrogenase iron-sulfur subunit
MYVLPHNDKPELYAGLPNNPRISALVEAWKGITKYAGLGVLGLAALAGFVHHAVTGANRVTEEDETHGKRVREGTE